MKKSLYLLVNLLLISQLTTAQSVTLATTTTNPTSGTVFYNNGTNQLQYWNGTAWIPITNAAAGTGWALNGNNINNNNTGNVGIGTSTPKATFNVAYGKTVLLGSDTTGVGNKLIWYPSKGAFRVGSLDTYSPNNWDYINVGNASLATGQATIAKGYLSTAMGYDTKALGTSSTAFGSGSLADGYVSTALGNQTYASGQYSTAMGTNTKASGTSSTAMGEGTIASGPSSNAMGSYNVNVPNALLMIGNGTYGSHSNALTVMNDGKVGIGTTAPAPLHVTTSASLSNSTNHYFSWATGSSITTLANAFHDIGILSEYDIVTKNSFVSSQTVTTSDARIKNIIGLSNNQQDLAKVCQIQITDYHYKDVANWGNQTFKKVIAQQVEEVYPQAVKKMTSTIPDIYSLAEKVVYDETNKKLTVSLSKNYEIRIDDKIEFVHEKHGKIQAIVESVSGNSFTVRDWQYPTDKIFVYGREVNDFRSVDYEAISMLGISAIQQLAKENEALKSKFTTENDLLKKQMADLNMRFEHLEAMMTKEIKTIEKLNN
ncbi:tail fiber domain-containing protein [Emticicia sp.]|uniref:tail fiber domain-containing protein n=1 Tax=Emticicia sp. TaxID=1930953 RepID=UPI003753A6B0